MNGWQIVSIFVAIVPAVLLFVLGRVFPTNSVSYNKPSFQPPNQVFGLVWAYLSLALGILTAYHLCTRTKTIELVPVFVLYLLVLGLWCAWLPVFTVNRTWSLVVLIASLVAVVAYLIVLGMCRQHQLWWMFPACIWLGLAAAMNGAIVYQDHHPST